jgi:hypothetical protein
LKREEEKRSTEKELGEGRGMITKDKLEWAWKEDR